MNWVQHNKINLNVMNGINYKKGEVWWWCLNVFVFVIIWMEVVKYMNRDCNELVNYRQLTF